MNDIAKKYPTEALVPATLDEETTNQIIRDAESARLFAKATDTGEFKIGEELVPRLIGRVVEVDRFAGRWITGGGMEKIRNFTDEQDLPEDYELRADVTIITPEGLLVTVSLPPSSYKFHFANQVKRLNRLGRDITECLSEFTVKTAKGKSGIFPVVICKVQEPQTPRPIKPDLISKAMDRDILDDEIPF